MRRNTWVWVYGELVLVAQVMLVGQMMLVLVGLVVCVAWVVDGWSDSPLLRAGILPVAIQDNHVRQ